MDARNFDDTVGLLYDSILEPALWPQALAAVAAFGGAEHAALNDLDYLKRILWRTVQFNIDEAWTHEYLGKYSAIDVRIPYILAHKGDRMWSDRVGLDEDTRANHPVYRDYLNKYGIKECLHAKVAEEGNRLGILTLNRHGDEIATDEQHQLLSKLLPHISRALTISRRFIQMAEYGHVGHALLDNLTEPIATVTRSGYVKKTNAPFEQLMATTSAIKLRQGTIVCNDPDIQRRLLDALSEAHALAFREPLSDGRIALMLNVPDRAGRDLRVSVAPIPPVFGVQSSDASGALLKIVDSSSPPDPAVLIQGFGLTPAEANLTRELMLGGRGPEIAARLGVSLNTVNTQLAGIYGKTKTHSRADLMVLIADLPR